MNEAELDPIQVRELDSILLRAGGYPGTIPDIVNALRSQLPAGARIVALTGWGQDGPMAQAAGHDINYIALAGNLHGYGRADGKPTPPANAVGDFGGGGMLLAFAMLAGILSARATGKGSVIDCAMVDGAALIAAQTWSLMAAGMRECLANPVGNGSGDGDSDGMTIESLENLFLTLR